MAPFARKGRNPGPVDEWLETIGYYRKNVAYDETCLFRAVSEQLFSSQLFHQKIRKECIAYARDHHEQFVDFIPSKEEWNIRLDRLEKHMAICGKTEMHMISKRYKKGIVLFDGITLTIKELTGKQYKDNLFLCHMGEDHFDAVYYKSYIVDAGFCQSIVYSTLYENVFHIPMVPNIVEKMLYHKPLTVNGKTRQEDANNNYKKDTRSSQSNETYFTFGVENKDETLNDYELMLKTNLAPFPFKVAKALDPTIYRNIEYDTWTEMRKETLLGDWYYGDNNLIEGSGCILNEHGEEYHCYIQEIIKQDESAIVFLTKKAEKRRVRLADLRPEADAKPWPLPYRFSKHLVISVPKLELADRKGLRKRREKKRTTSSNSEITPIEIAEVSGSTANSYEGAPLMQQEQLQTPKQEPENTDNQVSISGQTSQIPYEDGWDQQDSWQQTSTPVAQNSFDYSPVQGQVQQQVYIQSDGQSVPQPYYSNEYQPYSIWPNGQYIPPIQNNSQVQSPQSGEVPVTPDYFNFILNDSNSYSPGYYPTNQTYQSAPNTTQVELYQPSVYQPTISTPVIIAPAEMLPTPPSMPHMTMYSPAPIEIPYTYYPQSPFVFPPTPTQPVWYQPPPVNSQGFIFPTINVTPTSPAPTGP